jgi:hypothetical protein
VGRAREEPAIYKIWATSAITSDSVGGGESIPARLIPPPITAAVNDPADTLGYVRVDGDSGTPGRPYDPRLPVTIRIPIPEAGLGVGGKPVAAGTRLLAERLRARLACIDDRFTHRWRPCLTESFLIVSRPPAAASDGEMRWLVDLATSTISTTSGCDSDSVDAEWSIVGSPDSWRAVLLGEVNLNVAMRRRDLRYCDSGEAWPFAAQIRTAMMADLLSISSWKRANPAGSQKLTAVGLPNMRS